MRAAIVDAFGPFDGITVKDSPRGYSAFRRS